MQYLRFTGSALLPGLLLLSALPGLPKDPLHTLVRSASAEPRRIAVVSGFDIPESAKYDPEQDVIFVASIGRHATAADNNGFISRVTPDGAVASRRFIAGGQRGVTLHAPKGMTIVGDTLWVTDVTVLRGFHRRNGRPLALIDLGRSGAVFLNDVAAGPDGSLYLSDTGLRFAPDGEVSHPGPDRVFHVSSTRKVSVIAQGDTLAGPNGVFWDQPNKRLLIASIQGKAVFSWRPGDRSPVLVTAGPGGYDGIDRLSDGRIVIASQDAQAVLLLRGCELSPLITGIESPGDIGVDTRRNRVVIPRLGANVVEIWEIPVLRSSSRRTPSAELVASGLEVPWAIAAAPDGRLFLTERPGRIRVIANSRLLPRPWFVLDIARGRDAGLHGIALAPDFATTRQVYVTGTFRDEGGELEQRVYRLVDSSGMGSALRLIAGGYPAPDVHRGGALAFGPDGLLYFSVGDVRDLRSPQDSTRPAGKIFRIRRDGTIPYDNPWPGLPAFALGLRNPQGLAWHPHTGELFATEHGPTDFPDEGGRADQDELNLIVPGGNYGWPLVSGLDSDRRFRSPLAEWTPAIAPAALAFYTGPYAPWRNNLFVGGMRSKQLRRIVLARTPPVATGWRVLSEQPLFQEELGRIRAVAMGRDGFLYFATSNRDSDGDTALGMDRMFRLRVP